LDWES